MSPVRRLSATIAAGLLFAANTSLANDAGQALCVASEGLCRGVRAVGELSDASTALLAPPRLPAPLSKAGTLPSFYVQLDGLHYTVDLTQPAALFMRAGTFSVRSTSMTNCRRSDGQAQVIDANWYLFYGTSFSIIYGIQSINYRLPRTPDGRYVLEMKTSSGLMVCDGAVVLGPNPDDMIFRDGLESPGATSR